MCYMIWWVLAVMCGLILKAIQFSHHRFKASLTQLNWKTNHDSWDLLSPSIIRRVLFIPAYSSPVILQFLFSLVDRTLEVLCSIFKVNKRLGLVLRGGQLVSSSSRFLIFNQEPPSPRFAVRPHPLLTAPHNQPVLADRSRWDGLRILGSDT